MGYQVPPGISDATVPNPDLQPHTGGNRRRGQQLDQLELGPAGLIAPLTNTALGNYGPSSTSSTINYIPSVGIHLRGGAVDGLLR